MSCLGKCRLQGAFKRLKIPISDPTTPESLDNFRKGNELERTLTQKLLDEGRKLTHTVVNGGQARIKLLTRGILLSGSPDGFEEQKTVIEIKTASQRVFTRWKRQGVAGVRPAYLAQTHAYMAATGIWKTEFLVANRDRKDETQLTAKDLIKEELVFDLAYWEGIIQQWEKPWALIKEGELPEPDYKGDDWHCDPKYCNWSSICPSGQLYQRRQSKRRVVEVD